SYFRVYIKATIYSSCSYVHIVNAVTLLYIVNVEAVAIIGKDHLERPIIAQMCFQLYFCSFRIFQRVVQGLFEDHDKITTYIKRKLESSPFFISANKDKVYFCILKQLTPKIADAMQHFVKTVIRRFQ